MNKLSARTKQALEYSLGKQAAKEIFNLINDLSSEIDRLQISKVDITPIHSTWPSDTDLSPASGAWPPQNDVAITQEDINYWGLHDHVGQDPLSQTDEVK